MSGTNPFRRKGPDQNPNFLQGATNNAFGVRPETRVPPIDTDLPRSSKSKPGKTVRIISPHSATSDNELGLPADTFETSRFLHSPPPPEPISPEGFPDRIPEDPFNADSDGGGGSTEDEETNQSDMISKSTPQAPSQTASGVPANPFNKTLATLEGGRPISQQPAQTDDSKASKPQYDVDDFKRLLLTGERTASGTSASGAPPVSFHNPHVVGDSSSNTDTSSISRHSIFEPASGPLNPSPHTSQENLSSDDERKGLAESASKHEKIKPSTPRHRHGQLVKASTPLTVSFEDPAFSFSGTGANEVSQAGDSMPRSPRPSGGSDQTLSPLSSGQGSKSDSQAISTNTNRTQEVLTERPKPAVGTTQDKRNPPPPPLSRRHSQLKPKNPPPSSEQSLPISEEPISERASFPSSPPTNPSKAPLPPRPRRSGNSKGISSPSGTTNSPTAPIPDPTSSAAEETSPSTKPKPPHPQSWTPSQPATAKRPPLGSNSPSTAPPPPPRRRGSSHSSYNPARFSGNYSSATDQRLRSDSGASSISQLQMSASEPPQGERKDVMADLSALQREVDELRGKFGT